MSGLKVLVVGGGAREHALAWRLAGCASVERVFAAPGNPGLARLASLVPLEGEALVAWAAKERLDLVVIGPEAPLVAGLGDRLRERKLAVVGPSALAARMEGSKAWAKGFCERHGIPTARARVFDAAGEAAEYAARQQPPVVVKADGLAAGKGVVVAASREEAAEAALTLGAQGRVVIEECLTGPELSVFALCDGRDHVLLTAARDYKRLNDGNQGPNTGGMGAFSPVPGADADLLARIDREVFVPAFEGLAEEGCPYVGVLYAGLMLTPDGPKILEFNARFGDPEAQVIVPRWGGDPAEVLLAAARGELRGARPEFRPEAAVGIVLATPGYPSAPQTGQLIDGLDELPVGSLVFHAATRQDGSGWRTAGGRVLTVVALGADLDAARRQAYAAAAALRWDGCQRRGDIAAV